MNTDVSFIRGYIIPAVPTQNVSSNFPAHYHKLLPQRRDFSRSAKKSSSTNPTVGHTMTLIEQLKGHNQRSISNFNYFPNPLPRAPANETKTLTPRELSTQLNSKLEHLIRTRTIERSRVIYHSSMLPSVSVKSRPSPLLSNRDSCNRTFISHMSQSTDKPPASSSSTATTVIAVHSDDPVDKDSFDDNDDAFEEMVEEENINFFSQAP